MPGVVKGCIILHLVNPILPSQVTSVIRAMFTPGEMVISRLFQVLDGAVDRGKILVDNPDKPAWAAVQEPFDHALFLGGSINSSVVAELFALLRMQGDVIVGMTADDPRLSLLPPHPYYDGFTLEFYDRPIGKGLDAILRQLPTGCQLQRLDRESILRTEWGPNDVTFYGGAANWEKACLGFVLMKGDEILSEATVGSPGRTTNLYEPGVFTQPDHRGKGYGTLVSARLIQEIESMGGTTFWNCAKQNQASAAIARKLGYRSLKEFRCLAWEKQPAEFL